MTTVEKHQELFRETNRRPIPTANPSRPVSAGASWEEPQAIVAAVTEMQAGRTLGIPHGCEREMVSRGWPPVAAAPSRAAAWLEAGLMATGVALVGFMSMHMLLLLSSVVGVATMDRLADFLERYYLLQAAAPFVVLLILAHVFLALRKLPTGAREQLALVRQMRSLRHLDTWMWGVQIVTGFGLLLLAAIHLWVILTDLPIQAVKSGARVHGVYLGLYVPFIVLVEAHASAGLYRIAVKWGLTTRRRAHAALAVWTALFLALGFLILVTLYRIGAQP